MELKTEVPRYKRVESGSTSFMQETARLPRTVKVFRRGDRLTVPMEKLDREWETHPYTMTVKGDPYVERGKDWSGAEWTRLTFEGTRQAAYSHGYGDGIRNEGVSFQQWDHSPNEMFIDVWYLDRPYQRAPLRVEHSMLSAKGARIDQIGDLLGVRVVTPNTPKHVLPPMVMSPLRKKTRKERMEQQPRLTK